MTKVTYNSNLEDITYVAFDVETTGLSAVANRLVELSGVKFDFSGEKTETFSELINPETPIPPEVTKIHGITDSMVRGKPTIKEVVPKFLNWIGPKSVLIAHNAPFDLDFMRVNIARLGLECPDNYVLDTLIISRELMPDAPRHQLQTIVELLKLPSGGYHRALADSVHVKDVFITLSKSCKLKQFENLCAMGAVSTFNFDQFFDEVFEALSPEDKQTLELLKVAIEAKKSIEMTYNGSITTNRKVNPISIVHSRGQFYLTAYCTNVNAERTFRIDRISKLKAGSI